MCVVLLVIQFVYAIDGVSVCLCKDQTDTEIWVLGKGERFQLLGKWKFVIVKSSWLWQAMFFTKKMFRFVNM